MNIATWLRSKNITSHTVAAFALSAAALITTNQQVQQFVLALFKAHPAVGADIVLLAGIILKYSHSSSDEGTLATAQTIKVSRGDLTAADIDAATKQ